MMLLGNFFPFTFNATLCVCLILLLFYIFPITTTSNTLLSIPFIFHAFGQEDIEKDKEMIIGFGGNNASDQINTDSNGSISNIGEINRFNSNSQGLEILVTVNNISNLLAIDNENISKNMFLKAEESNSFSPEYQYLTYKFKKSDFNNSYGNNNNKTVLFLFYPGIINDGTEFKVCLYYFNEYNKRIMCENGVNEFENKSEKMIFNIPHIINLDTFISQNNNKHNISDNETNHLKELNISNYDNIDLRYTNSELDNSNLKFIASIDKLLLINSNNDNFNNKYYLTEINGSNINNYTEKQISGNGILRIDGFGFNEKNKKIYAFGDYDYLKGSNYDIKYGLAEEYNDHMIFVVDPITAKIIDSVKLWGGQEEGDESTIGNTFINYDNNELYATALDEGELAEIFVIDGNDLKIKSVISINDFTNQQFYNDALFDDINNIFYMCNGDSIIGVNIDERTIVKNFSSIYCPMSIDSKEQKGYFIDHQDIRGGGGFIDFAKENNYILLKKGNISAIIFHDNDAFVVGHSTDNYYSCASDLGKDKSIISYIIKIDITSGYINGIYKFNNVYIDNLVVNPSNKNLYAKTTEIISDSYTCYQNSKLYNLGIKV